MREREALARDGFVVIHLCLDRKKGTLTREPQIVSKGFVFIQDSEAMFNEVRSKIKELVKSSDGEDLDTRIQKELSKYFYAETKRRPMIILFTSEAP